MRKKAKRSFFWLIHPFDQKFKRLLVAKTYLLVMLGCLLMGCSHQESHYQKIQVKQQPQVQINIKDSEHETVEILEAKKVQEKKELELLGIEFIYIPAGEFMMGSESGEADEKPAHRVYVDAFYISKSEVTFTQYDLFCDKTGHKKPSDAGYLRGNWQKMGVTEFRPGDLEWGRGNRPVINVSWVDAKTYCQWLSQITGKNIRLPYEAEWEYACRADTTGSHYGDFNSIAWHAGNSQDETHPVKGKVPNAFGLYDMLGNVWEWCEDWYDTSYYTKSSSRNPRGPSTGSQRVVRGGSWINDPIKVCTAYRRRGCSPDKSGGGLGFRLVMGIK